MDANACYKINCLLFRFYQRGFNKLPNPNKPHTTMYGINKKIFYQRIPLFKFWPEDVKQI